MTITITYFSTTIKKPSLKTISYSNLETSPKPVLLIFFQVKRHAEVKIDQKRLDDLISLASDLSSVGDPKHTDNLYERSKCPGEFTAPQIPATAFKRVDADSAVKIAEKIVALANLIIAKKRQFEQTNETASSAKRQARGNTSRKN